VKCLDAAKLEGNDDELAPTEVLIPTYKPHTEI